MFYDISFDTFLLLISESLGIEKKLLSENISLRDDLGIDSLSIINFIVKLEKQYNIQFNTDSLWEARTLGEVYGILNKQLLLAEAK